MATSTITLGIETSCDETGVALYCAEKGLLAHALHSQVDLHAVYGGVVPEIASRDHVRMLLPLIQQVMSEVGIEKPDAIAYTAGPGLVGALMVGGGMANGLDSDVDGLLLAAEHENRRVSRTLANGMVVDVATEFMGDRLNSPNDIAVRSDGTIYFTDPPYGINPTIEQELDFNGVFRVAPDGALTAEWEGDLSSRPNGLVLSPNESILYVAETTSGVMAFDVNADGSLANERDFVEVLLGADGMAMDTGGNLFVSAATGVQVHAPDGTLWGAIELPGGAVPSNCAFGSSDARTLYITARSQLFQVRLANPGLY